MALNPIAFTEDAVQGFLRYQLNTHVSADSRPNRQMREFSFGDVLRRIDLLVNPTKAQTQWSPLSLT